MKYYKKYENYFQGQYRNGNNYEDEFYDKMRDFNEDDYHPTAIEYANKYYRDEKNPRGAYGDYFEIVERLDDFCTTDFPYGIENIPNPVKLYRLLNVESEESINKEELGKHFVGDKDMFDDYDFVESFLHRYGEETKKWFIVTVETTRDNLDMGQILGNRAEYPNEYEFTVKSDKNLKIVEIEEKEPW